MPGESTRHNFSVLLGLAWLVVVAELLMTDWNNAGRTLFDTDDALRLVQMRAWLSGQGWFDLHEARLGPPLGYDSHWSRLIDAGLAGLFLLFNLFTNAAWAERLMRVVWPLLWLLPAIGAVAALAWRIAGRQAALVALLMVVVGMPALQQFRPGRIDHHNVQIALALATLAVAAWSDQVRWMSAVAGGLTGLALAIGLEGLPFLMVAGAAPALHYARDRNCAGALRNYGLALAASTVGAFLVSVGPDHWNHSVCDTMAINWMAPVVTAGLLLAAAGHLLASERAAIRSGAVVTITAIAAIVFVAIEPRCLGGPFAMMDPALRPIWLAHVAEMQPLLTVAHDTPSMGAKILAFPAVTLVAMLLLAREPAMRRNPGVLLTGAAFLVAMAMTIAAAKVYSYALWMGMPLVAAWSPRLFARFHLVTFAARSFAVILLTPATLTAGAIAVVHAAGHGDGQAEENPRDQRGCFDSANYAQLAQLPKGVIATDVDYGPHILALTPHAVLGGPYHRLPAGILAAHQAFALPPAAARQVIARNGVTYLVTCGDYIMVGVTVAERAASLWTHLAAGDIPIWLEKLPAAAGQIFTVYRVNASAP
jgi:hypothetical protein